MREALADHRARREIRASDLITGEGSARGIAARVRADETPEWHAENRHHSLTSFKQAVFSCAAKRHVAHT